MPIQTPPNEMPIDEMFVFVSEDENGNHGVLAGYIGSVSTPMVCATERVAELMKPIALTEIGRRTGMTVKLLHLLPTGKCCGRLTRTTTSASKREKSAINNGTQPKHSKH